MPKTIRLDRFFLALLFGSFAPKPYGVSGVEVSAAVRDLIERLWSANEGLVPIRTASARLWRSAGRVLGWLGLILLVVWAPAAYFAPDWVPRVLSPEDQAKGFLIGLVTYVLPVIGVALMFASFASTRHSVTITAPSNIAAKVVGGKSPLLGRILLGLTSRRTPWRMILLGLLGIVLSGYLLGHRPEWLPPGAAKAFFAAWLLLLVAGVFLKISLWVMPPMARLPLDSVTRDIHRTGQSLMQPTTDELRHIDRRKPIILLRSFRDDDIEIKGEASYLRLEEVLAGKLHLLGPLIAIGRPKESLPELGAARSYYSDAEWQTAVSAWLAEALLIVVVAGQTSGLQWEVESIAAQGLLPKLLVVMPPVDVEQRWSKLAESLGKVTPRGPAAFAERPKGVLCVHGTPQGDMTVIAANAYKALDYERALNYALYGMFCAPPEAAKAV